MDELFVFLAKERSEAPAGERGSPTPSAAENVERKLQHIWVNLDEMATAETKSILKKNLQKMRTILSSSPQKIYLEKSHYFKGFCCFSIAIAVNGGQGTHFLISQILKGLTHCTMVMAMSIYRTLCVLV